MALPRKCLALTLLFTAGCGYVGEPKPPSLDIPKAMAGLRVFERQDKVAIDFTIPELTTEQLPLRLGSVELLAEFDGESRRLNTSSVAKPGPVHLEYPLGDWIGKEVRFRVRVFSRKGRDSGWSETKALRVVPPLEKPTGLRAEAVAQGVRLQWEGPQDPAGVAFRILRRSGDEKSVAEAATAPGREWVDTQTRYGVLYEYSVQAILKSGGADAESEISSPVQITPVDRFPPAVPSGLTSLTGPASVELAWDPNTETDLAGYYLYRSTGEGPFVRLGDLLEAPSYSDRDVKAGVRYRYAVSSVDRSGNESARSGTVEAALQ